MAKKFLVSINLNGNELQNVLVHPLATAPSSPSEGQVYYNTGTNTIHLYDGSQWLDITGSVTGISSTTTGVTIGGTSSVPSIDIATATSGNTGLMPGGDKTKLDAATNAATASTLVLRDANGDASFNELTTTGNITINGTPTELTDAATVQYVQSIVASGMTVKGAIDASTNPNYPAAAVGDAYHISVAGKIGGVAGPDVEIGDMILCVTTSGSGGDHATVGGDWIILQDNIGQASETVPGYVELATQAEVDAGSDTTRAVTPATLASAISGLGGGTVNVHQETVGNAVNTQFVINHGFSNQYCQVQIFDATTHEEVVADVTLTDANNVTVDFAVAPGTNEFRVVVTG